MDEEQFKELLGQNVKRLRKQKNMTQLQIADIIGIEPHNFNRIENGKSFPQIKTLISLINYFNISVSELFINQNDNSRIKHAINEILDKNPQKLKEFYNILLAITS